VREAGIFVVGFSPSLSPPRCQADNTPPSLLLLLLLCVFEREIERERERETERVVALNNVFHNEPVVGK
jgi:hypothetical protein